MAGQRGDLQAARPEGVQVFAPEFCRSEQPGDIDVGVAREISGADLDTIEAGLSGDVEHLFQRTAGVERGENA